MASIDLSFVKTKLPLELVPGVRAIAGNTIDLRSAYRALCDDLEIFGRCRACGSEFGHQILTWIGMVDALDLTSERSVVDGSLRRAKAAAVVEAVRSHHVQTIVAIIANRACSCVRDALAINHGPIPRRDAPVQANTEGAMLATTGMTLTFSSPAAPISPAKQQRIDMVNRHLVGVAAPPTRHEAEQTLRGHLIEEQRQRLARMITERERHLFANVQGKHLRGDKL